jgi:ketosteroid isomerase-like protein
MPSLTEARALMAALHAAQNAFYSGSDERPLRELLDPAIIWIIPGDNAIAGRYCGVPAVLDYMRRRRDLAGGSFRMHPGEVLVGDGDHVASLTDGTATIGGREHRWSTVGLYRVCDGRIAACTLLTADQATFDLIWSG